MPDAPQKPSREKSWLQKLGPGLITGAADDDPSGIATYNQVGAAFGYGMLWTCVLTIPLMIAIQIVSAQIGRVTGNGIAANIRGHFPPWLLNSLVWLLFLANTINIAADVGAMGAAVEMLGGGPWQYYAIGFGLVSLVLQVFVPFPRYAPFLKTLTLALFAYVGIAFVVQVPWGEVARQVFVPSVPLTLAYAAGVVAVLGTTISPYLFFWQASQEVEEQRAEPGEEPLKEAPEQAPRNFARIKVDTYVGMLFSNLIAFFIMLTAAVTLHSHGVTNIQTSAQAAEALRPIAGDFAFWLFAAGMIGSGMLAVPTLAGSAAYAVAEAFKWKIGLGRELLRAKGFYAVLAVCTLLGVAINLAPINPIQALLLSAVINGVIAVPIMAMIMLLAGRADVMGKFVVKRRLRVFGWLATAVMAVAVLVMFVGMAG
jgi:Mn2+/Fe2+ NRAMP family transporter